MASVKNFFKKETDSDKIQSQIDGMVLRKNSLVSVVENEISVLKREIDSNIYQAGLHAYNQKEIGSEELNFKEFWDKIDVLKVEVITKEKKSSEISFRYDDEISMLQTTVQMSVPIAKQQPMTGATCSGCGLNITEGDLFCEHCGNKV